VIVPAWIVVLHLDGDYPRLLDASPLGIGWQVLRTGVISTALVAFYLYATKNPFSRIFILSEGIFGTCFLSIEKAAVLHLFGVLRRRGWGRRNVLIVGDDEHAARAARAIRDDRRHRMEVWGCLARIPESPGSRELEIRGALADYRQLIWKSPIDEVLISPAVAGAPEATEILRYCELIGVTARMIPGYAISDPRILSRMSLDSFLELPTLMLAAGPARHGQLLVKRTIDCIASTLLLIVLSPLLAILAVAVKLSSAGPVFYRWRVMGTGIKPFTGYKFRTMVADAEERKAGLAARNEMSGPVFKIRDDPRITALGRWLRKYSLDELPQLWSVLKGDMSLVGPRPPGPHEFEHFEIWHRRKLSVKPGITCLWQVMGRNRIADFDDWVTLDLQYIDNWSLWLDFKILAKTAATVIRGTGV
jgi:exopolysaccharide biosynthesis polyprenyl glycosylphosphotransferase